MTTGEVQLTRAVYAVERDVGGGRWVEVARDLPTERDAVRWMTQEARRIGGDCSLRLVLLA